MSEYILFVFEGEKTERTITDSLLKYFINGEHRVVISSFKTDIYSLYGQLKKDEDLDAFAIVKERDESLSQFSRDSFSQMYLFFDYDGHSCASDDNKISELLEFFDEETDNGKLFISYPMVEALKCLSKIDDLEGFCEHTYLIKEGKAFKNYTSEYACKSLIQFKNYSSQMWNDIVRVHCSKANYLMMGDKTFPVLNLSQRELFALQKERFIDLHGSVSILGSFPLLLLDFFGSSLLSTLVSGQVISATENVLRLE